jgi:16S rRNA (cytosine1402-N4)-methyltransferase
MTHADEEDDTRRDGAPLQYATEYHAPVLWKHIVDGLITDPSGVYVDATLGGGGHAAALLDALAPAGRVLGIDRDPEALAAARERLHDDVAAGRFRAVHGNFGDLESLLDAEKVIPVDGVLFDLGVSSHQIDEAARGFSFQQEGPLDMRMNPRAGLTAHQVVNAWRENDLKQAFYRYGEERRAPQIARAIVTARPIETTDALADVIRGAVPERDEVKTLARVFQAIRIVVNDELDVLERALEQAASVVRPGGRIAVISYHSLEDRRAKRYLRYGNFEGEPVRDLYGHLIAPWREIHRKPIRATDAEVAANPRARSARLRVAERRDDAEVGPPAPNP